MSKNKFESGQLSNSELIKKTQEIEDEKAEKKRIRLEKKLAKEKKKRREQIDKLIAPALLILTILISLVVGVFSR